jgi:glycerophosphodiester phosphodiesterase
MNNEIAKILLENNAQISAKDNLGRTALFVAASTANTELMNAMLEYNDGVAAIDIPDSQFGFTPLHVAVTLDDREMTELLLREGASTSIPDRVGMGTVQSMCASDMRVSCVVVRSNRR